MVYEKYRLRELQPNEIIRLAEFIVVENFKHHRQSCNDVPFKRKKEILSVYNQEMDFLNSSKIFVAEDTSGNIVGFIRILKWNGMDVLPLQRIFGIDSL
ncbi:hypothetical protein [Polaribacter cellanae]|uniref:Uncharacterized protein n=1 Tax=Polaribacter cellanae TaxID=2818493 RepID=A0A975H9Z1_9FLAO|nr:hypothetical protein [Polaribacter cellanae]QTE23610.1 hypothetical protein J3359_04835 [Polaribacter cellanae]